VGRVTGRTWTVELPSHLPLINANRRMHYHRRAELTRGIRVAAFVCARSLKVPALKRAHIVCEFRPPDHRRRDVHNLFPSAKAAIDGLVDAGVLRDDSDAYLTGPDMRRGDVEQGGRIVLHIEELEA
jgi:Holliday junction resolvase RusA-like endonuclease